MGAAVRNAGDRIPLLKKAIIMSDGCCEEAKMEWVITLIVLIIVPFWIVLWWIPHCDAIGIQKAKAN
jgi:hypothetical protein